MKDEPITVEDYKLVSDEFFQKYNFVAERSESYGGTEWCSHERTSER